MRCNIFKKKPKQSLSSTKFFALVVSLYFQFGFRFMRSFALTAYIVHQDLDRASWSDHVWWNDCCWRTRLIIFARMQVHFFLRFPFFSLATENDDIIHHDEPWCSSLSLLFCFCALKDDDKLVFVVVFLFCFFAPQRRRRPLGTCHLFLFCFCAHKENNDELMLVVVLFCFFVFVHPKKMTTNQHSLSSCFVLFLCT